MKYIIEFEDEPCMREDGLNFYKCIQAPWWSLSERLIKQLTPYQPDHTADIDKKVSISCGRENDQIYREAAIEALARMMPHSYTPDGSHPADEEIFRVQEVFADCIEALEILPSAQPEPHEGHWIGGDGSYICSECNGSPMDFINTMGASFDAYVETPMNFCPNCGADMRGGGAE